MDLDQLQERWRQLDHKLDRTLATNSAVLRQAGLPGTRRRIDRLAGRPAIDVAFGMAVLLVTGSFLGDHWPEPTLILPALGLMVASVLFVIDNIRQLASASGVAWDGSIADIQLAVSGLRRARIRQFKWIILLSPLLWLCMMTVAGKLIFGVNVIEAFDPAWVVANIVFGVLFVPAGVMIARVLGRRWQSHPFWRNVLDDISGRSLARAQQELKSWAELGNEPPA